jgi:hypothetical protein
MSILGTDSAKPIRLYGGRLPHYFAGLVLLLFAASHFIMLIVHSPSQHSISTVFPFLTNWTVYLLAGIFELATAFICLKNRGRELANWAIFTFVIVIVWYRWALSYTGGGKTCECLGILGQALHLSKTQEEVIPIVVLVLLALTITPWLVHKPVEIARSLWSNRGTARNLAIILCAFMCYQSYGQETVEVTGEYDGHHYNPKTGVPYANYTRHAAFTCTFSGKSWSIYATNIDANPDGLGQRTPWEGLVYDGTNTYILMPNLEKVMGIVESQKMGKSCSVRATVSHGLLFLPDYDEWLDFYSVWLAYGLCPTNLPADFIKNGVIGIPLPWKNTRLTPMAYGFEWKITPSANGRFMSECEVLRNTNLDLNAKEETLRPSINPPLSLQGFNHFNETLEWRRGESWGFVAALYKCSKWYDTNGVLLPAEAEFKICDPYFTNSPLVLNQIRVVKVTVRRGLERLLPQIKEKILVADYRYRRADGVQVFPYMEYLLAPGDSWKSDNDPKLLNMAKIAVRWGHSLEFPENKRRSRCALLILMVLFLVPPVLIYLYSKHQNQTK